MIATLTCTETVSTTQGLDMTFSDGSNEHIVSLPIRATGDKVKQGMARAAFNAFLDHAGHEPIIGSINKTVIADFDFFKGCKTRARINEDNQVVAFVPMTGDGEDMKRAIWLPGYEGARASASTHESGFGFGPLAYPKGTVNIDLIVKRMRAGDFAPGQKLAAIRVVVGLRTHGQNVSKERVCEYLGVPPTLAENILVFLFERGIIECVNEKWVEGSEAEGKIERWVTEPCLDSIEYPLERLWAPVRRA